MLSFNHDIFPLNTEIAMEASPSPSLELGTPSAAEPDIPVSYTGACRVFSLGERVFAKMKGYPHWPALITEVPSGQKKVLDPDIPLNCL